MKLWKCVLLAFLFGPATDFLILAANIFHDEPWKPTPKWLMAAGVAAYYTIGVLDQIMEDWIIHPIIFIGGSISGPLFMPLFLGLQMIVWTTLLYFGAKAASELYRRIRQPRIS